jgi:hypothetical protein
MLNASQGKPGKRVRDEGSEDAPASKKSTGAANKILFAKGFPPTVAADYITAVFQQCQGLVEVRVPPGESYQGSAFVEFADDAAASVALKQLDGFQLSPTSTLKLEYSK